MSALIGHAKAARIMCAVLANKAKELLDGGHESEALIIVSLADVNNEAANRMEQAMREEATGYEDVP